jgi:hypothetical protein
MSNVNVICTFICFNICYEQNEIDQNHVLPYLISRTRQNIWQTVIEREGEKGNKPNIKTVFGISSSIASEIEIPSHKEKRTKGSTNTRMPYPS